MARPRIVIDTNVLVAALRSDRGASYRLIQQCGRKKFDHILSIPLALEYEAACRFCMDGQEEAEIFLSQLIATAELAEIFFRLRPLLPDPKDDMIVEAAVNERCDHVVTFNRKHFIGLKSYGISVISPGEFLTSIGI
jgi:predicted nucleic acid-binding protein